MRAYDRDRLGHVETRNPNDTERFQPSEDRLLILRSLTLQLIDRAGVEGDDKGMIIFGEAPIGWNDETEFVRRQDGAAR